MAEQNIIVKATELQASAGLSAAIEDAQIQPETANPPLQPAVVAPQQPTMRPAAGRKEERYRLAAELVVCSAFTLIYTFINVSLIAATRGRTGYMPMTSVLLLWALFFIVNKMEYRFKTELIVAGAVSLFIVSFFIGKL